MPSGNRINGHKSDIVAVQAIFVTGIAEANQQFHDTCSICLEKSVFIRKKAGPHDTGQLLHSMSG
ncbi:MAG: hypothetical protein Alpg2KO_06820 [Alphaproteobacteria bacterium]